MPVLLLCFIKLTMQITILIKDYWAVQFFLSNVKILFSIKFLGTLLDTLCFFAFSSFLNIHISCQKKKSFRVTLLAIYLFIVFADTISLLS